MGAEFSPLQLIATFPGFPYIPFGRDSPSMNRDLRDVGMARQARQSLSIMEKQVVVTAYNDRGLKGIEEFCREQTESAQEQGFAWSFTPALVTSWVVTAERDCWADFLNRALFSLC